MDEMFNENLQLRGAKIKTKVGVTNKSSKKKSSAMFPCTICLKEYKNKKYLARHVRLIHSEPTQHQCSYCGKMFHFKSKMLEHVMVHTGEKPYKCEECGKCFSKAFSLNSHKFIHTNQKPYKCSYCSYACRDCSTLRKHEARHNGQEKMYQCKMCEKKYKSKFHLKQHVAEKHLNLDVKNHECPECGKRFKERQNVTNHIQAVHRRSKTCKCEICGVTLTNVNNLPQHLRRHVDARPYVCSHGHCGKAFKCTSSLRKHQLIHYPDQQFGCEQCGKRFTREYRLRHHMKEHLPRVKRVQCDYCGVRFYSKNYLSKHILRKHMGTEQRYQCDICGLSTTNKPSIVMHLKYGHTSDKDTKCKICMRKYKLHKYLKLHYAKTHHIRYKTRQRTPKVEIKEEPEDEKSIDLFEIEKQEPFEDEIIVEANLTEIIESNPEQNTQSISEALTEDTAQHLIEVNRRQLQKIPEKVFDEFYIEKVVRRDGDVYSRKSKYGTDKKSKEYVQKCVKKLLGEARQKNIAKTVERARRMYNKRMKAVVTGVPGKEHKKIKYFNKNQKRYNKLDHNENKSLDSHSSEDGTEDERNRINDKSNSINEISVLNKENDSQDNPLNDDKTSLNNNESLNDIESLNCEMSLNVKRSLRVKKSLIRKGSLNSGEHDEDSGSNYSDEEGARKTKPKGVCSKVKFNTHQCYICFKLYETKEKLLEHCKDHFDICTNKSLKKCPLCEHVCKMNLSRHMKLEHNVEIDIPYARIKDKKHCTNGSRYYIEIDNPQIKKVEIIPSIKNLNKIASLEIDRKRKEIDDKMISKTKLVKKGDNWIVEKERIDLDVNEFTIKDIDEEVLKGVRVRDENAYFDKMKKLYHVAKRSGKKMMFPCESCDKICQTLSALKLHSRKHDPNAKPFKPKVWQHKLKGKAKVDKKAEVNTYNRTAKPKPIVNKHKCDPELMKFYENNIRGADIEFWQFLKIFNRMGRENVQDFEDLDARDDFGIHRDFTLKGKPGDESKNANVNMTNNCEDATVRSHKQLNSKVKFNKRNVKLGNDRNKDNSKASFAIKRVVMHSKKDVMRRNAIKNKLREEIAKNHNNL